MVQNGSFIDAIPIITLYAFAGYRLMPSFQQIYSSIAILRYAGPALDSLYDDMKRLKPLVAKYENIQEDVKFNENISLNDINFQYPNASRTSLKKINFSISARTTVGLVGPTGSGKTTLVDLILCLLEAQNGTLKVDGRIINKKNIKAWQNLIGYVPQNIYLTDDTITANIALGVDPMNIDHKEIVRAAKNASIHDFVINELPKKYETTVGERGIRLSGGQRQRIGIARALYRRPQLLILDEATSALDNLTEKIVMEAVQNIGKNITIIIIAHRLSTVRECDKIYLLENGQIKSQGRFEELIESDKNFKIAT
jgi:ABC-type multidrug transport system fused ATPase/permease subunit